MEWEEFVEACRQKEIDCSAKQQEQFVRYAQLLQEWNEKMNLTAITEWEEVLEKHFYDSLVPFAGMTLDAVHLCDVGAGAGFPSLPLKIMNPQLKITILEPLNKRVVFLKEVCQQLQLDQVECLNVRAELCREHREAFGWSLRGSCQSACVVRAVFAFGKKNGKFIAMKGAAGFEEQIQAEKATKILGAELEKAEEVHLQDGSTRVNLTYRKVKATSPQYPRAYAKIKKNPL
ncbi:MAG: 16S rRNA (guanine(527)-N(7))-methyltransferase RsmG [Holdemania massiliensis]